MGNTRGWHMPKKLVFTDFRSASPYEKSTGAYYNTAALTTVKTNVSLG